MKREELLAALREAAPNVNWGADAPENTLSSLDTLMIVSQLYSRFGVAVPPEELRSANFRSADAILSLCENIEKERN